MKAEIGTPSGSSATGSKLGHWRVETVKREFGCAALRPDSGVQSLPCQSIRCAGGASVTPSHHTSPSSVIATLVKITSRVSIRIALGLDFMLVPGATPKKPASGLMARNVPSGRGLIQAMSSPIVLTFQPSNSSGGTIIEKFVLPQADGNAAAT